ncbi:hypothetical protein OSB04_004894 [Centaurea solstitialis]|uniref:non-specific serine/threonine protein kinase n=1 Tax=Centaurea solstitialis TaxID=347529 RepID=A0AA38TGQ9_9ASTR|nr:hypothetical protein OSB04_004894 [Centaurea solstitialis]
MAGSIFFFFIFSLTIFLLLPFISSSIPTVSISVISSNQTLVCALTRSPTLQLTQLNCTTNSNSNSGIWIPSNDGIANSFVGIVGGTGFLCGLSSPFLNSSAVPTSFVVCWRFLPDGRTVYKRVYIGPALKAIDSGETHVCGIVNSTGQVLCWQWNRFGDYEPHRIRMNSVAVGEGFVCGLTEFGGIGCLGDYTGRFNVTESFPARNYSVVAAGYNRLCPIDVNGGLGCTDVTVEKPNGVFKSVVIGGDDRFCAIRVNGTVICWGSPENDFRLPENLRRESFAGLQANRGVFCGVLTTNYSLYCWGNESLNSISNSVVFEDVVPGLCTDSCPCRTVSNYAAFCSSGLKICEPCVSEQAPPEPPPLPPSLPPLPPQRDGGWSGQMVGFAVVGSVGCLSFLLVLVFLVFRFCKSSEGSRVHDSGPMEDVEIASRARNSNRILVRKLSHLISNGNGNHLQEFALQTIFEATNRFAEDNRIGIGSFGSVYRALLNDGRKVAVKRAELTNPSVCNGAVNKRQEDTNNAFVNELEFLSRVNHKNLVQLLGFCEEENELVLVYEYMENGSLHDHIHNIYSSYIMSWSARIKVALDAARGLQYLHVYADPPIIHRDIKSSNILLDGEWTGKVSDFGLSLMGPPDDGSHLSLHAAGTVGYMDPEYYKFEQLTTKSDVYSFGVVLLELLSGHRAIHKNEAGERRNVVDSVVPYIVHDEIHRVLDHKIPPPTPFEIEAVKYVGYLAVDCVTLEGKDRPTMSELVACLERALAACLTLPDFSRSSSGSST